MGMSKRKIRNRRVIKQLCTNFLKFNQVILVDLNNVSNAQIQKARRGLQATGGDLIVGKNTIINKALKWLTTEPEKGTKEYEDHSKWERKLELKSLVKEIQGNIAVIFSEEDYSTVKEKIEKEVLRVAAKVGIPSNCDVVIPPGPTNIDVGKVAVFQKLNVPTKAVRNFLEIQKEIHVIKKGEKVTANSAELCRLMDIKPFAYKLEMRTVWLNGTILKEDMINISPESLLSTFTGHAKTLAALSLGANLPNALSAPHMIANAFKDMLAIGIAADIKFKQLAQAQTAQASGPAPTAAPAKGGAPAPAKAAEPEPPAEEANVSMGGLFD